MNTAGGIIWWVYADAIDVGVYVVAPTVEAACRDGAAILGKSPGVCVARYVVTSSQPRHTIAALRARRGV